VGIGGELMATQLYLNVPVRDLDKSIAFFTRLGFEFDPAFTDDTATCMIVSENTFVMLLTEDKFRSFTPKSICDATKQSEVLIALSQDRREDVDRLVRLAVEAGGTTYKDPEDHGFMYGHGFQDLDGHIWEVFHMAPRSSQ
jgi:uncharacterized protein